MAMPGAAEHTSIHQCLRETLLDLNGKQAGEICDLLINRHTGKIDFIRVAVAEARESRKRFIAIPWSALRVPRDDDQPWSVQARRETLQKMARFEVPE